MQNKILFFVLTLINTALGFSSDAAEKSFSIGEVPIKNSYGCIYTEPSSIKKVILYGDYGSSGEAFIDGNKTELHLNGSDWMRAKKTGDRYSVQYRDGKDLFIQFTGIRMDTCKEDGPLCKSGKGKLTFEKGKSKQQREVIEWCGTLEKH